MYHEQKLRHIIQDNEAEKHVLISSAQDTHPFIREITSGLSVIGDPHFNSNSVPSAIIMSLIDRVTRPNYTALLRNR